MQDWPIGRVRVACLQRPSTFMSYQPRGINRGYVPRLGQFGLGKVLGAGGGRSKAGV